MFLILAIVVLLLIGAAAGFKLSKKFPKLHIKYLGASAVSSSNTPQVELILYRIDSFHKRLTLSDVKLSFDTGDSMQTSSMAIPVNQNTTRTTNELDTPTVPRQVTRVEYTVNQDCTLDIAVLSRKGRSKRTQVRLYANRSNTEMGDIRYP